MLGLAHFCFVLFIYFYRYDYIFRALKTFDFAFFIMNVAASKNAYAGTVLGLFAVTLAGINPVCGGGRESSIPF